MSKQRLRYKGKSAFQKMEEYLTEEYDFRYNAVYGVIEYKVKGEKGEYNRLDDYATNSIHRAMKWEGIHVGVGEMLSTLQSAYTPVYDPFLAYFEALPEWDGVDYIQQLADTITTNENFRGWWGTALKMWLIGAVACSIDAEKVNHSVLVLIGGQGIGKTTWMNKLVPNALKTHYFSGAIDPANKDTLAHLSECFLINLDELENLNRGELGSLKAMITQQSIRVRRPYGRLAENMTRRASFMGSVNSSEFLRDDTGNRRFLCFEANKIDMDHNINMNLVYAQALALHKAGHRYWLQGDENDKISLANEQFKVQHPEIEVVKKHFDVCAPGEETTLMSVASLQQFLLDQKEVMQNLDLRRLGIALKASSFQRTKRDGTWLYRFQAKS